MLPFEKAGMDKSDTRVYRHELKFLCGNQQLFMIEDRIRHMCRLDAYAGPEGIYSVKSLYFDTCDDQCYYENLAGADNRKKYRIRVYNDDMDTMKLECKYSCRGMKAKESCKISAQQYNSLITGGYGLKEQEVSGQPELLRQFVLEKNIRLLKPKVVVEYRRTPYVYPAGNVRITFDRRIRSSHQVLLFPERDVTFRNILPEGVHVLEVKYDGILPAAIRELLTAGQELRRTSFSKYALCRENECR